MTALDKLHRQYFDYTAQNNGKPKAIILNPSTYNKYLRELKLEAYPCRNIDDEPLRFREIPVRRSYDVKGEKIEMY